MTTEERVARLEKCLLTFAAIVSGEAATACKSQQELDALLMDFATTMKAMNDELYNESIGRNIIV